LVVEDKDVNRLKNLVFDHPVKTGDNVIYFCLCHPHAMPLTQCRCTAMS
jgi:hypothetical protein